MKETPKHELWTERMAKRHEEEVETPALDRKKAILQSLRDLHSHIDFKKIEREQLEKEREMNE